MKSIAVETQAVTWALLVIPSRPSHSVPIFVHVHRICEAQADRLTLKRLNRR